jgi:hypothetical protein
MLLEKQAEIEKQYAGKMINLPSWSPQLLNLVLLK